MVEAARSINSNSLFREAEYCVLVLKDEESVNYFQSLIDDVVEKRKDPDTTYTGAKDLKRQMLALLNQYGEVQTANVWCRGLIYDLYHINELRQFISERLASENIYGVLEIHLQDREINSPHIQFVGTQARRAEQIIAEAVVELQYERSIDSAMGHGYLPYYQANPSAGTYFLSDELEVEEREQIIAEIEAQDADFFTQMQSQRNEFIQMLQSSVSEAKEEITQIHITDLKRERMFYEKTDEEITQELEQKIKRFRRR